MRMRSLADLSLVAPGDGTSIEGQGLRYLKSMRSLRHLTLQGVRLNQAGRKASLICNI